MPAKEKAPRNRTITMTEKEITNYAKSLLTLSEKAALPAIANRTINMPLEKAVPFLPEKFADLLILDPPYNLSRTFHSNTFNRMDNESYTALLDSWLQKLVPFLKKNASVYICGDWKTSSIIQTVGERYFKVRNRIVWEREKGRGAKNNWKNCTEDIWFFTVGNEYTFNVEQVKLKRKVLAPYTSKNGEPKDWQESHTGKYRLTHPSNIWTDITIPFWSMPENTEHPTQKPEKLIAKLILASSNKDDVIFDPFLGSGTTSVTAKKLGRTYVGIEQEKHYCLLAEKRLEAAGVSHDIQGYDGSYFWERNTFNERKQSGQGGEQLSF